MRKTKVDFLNRITFLLFLLFLTKNEFVRMKWEALAPVTSTRLARPIEDFSSLFRRANPSTGVICYAERIPGDRISYRDVIYQYPAGEYKIRQVQLRYDENGNVRQLSLLPGEGNKMIIPFQENPIFELYQQENGNITLIRSDLNGQKVNVVEVTFFSEEGMLLEQKKYNVGLQAALPECLDAISQLVQLRRKGLIPIFESMFAQFYQQYQKKEKRSLGFDLDVVEFMKELERHSIGLPVSEGVEKKFKELEGDKLEKINNNLIHALGTLTKEHREGVDALLRLLERLKGMEKGVFSFEFGIASSLGRKPDVALQSIRNKLAQRKKRNQYDAKLLRIAELLGTVEDLKWIWRLFENPERTKIVFSEGTDPMDREIVYWNTLVIRVLVNIFERYGWEKISDEQVEFLKQMLKRNANEPAEGYSWKTDLGAKKDYMGEICGLLGASRRASVIPVLIEADRSVWGRMRTRLGIISVVDNRYTEKVISALVIAAQSNSGSPEASNAIQYLIALLKKNDLLKVKHAVRALGKIEAVGAVEPLMELYDRMIREIESPPEESPLRQYDRQYERKEILKQILGVFADIRNHKTIPLLLAWDKKGLEDENLGTAALGPLGEVSDLLKTFQEDVVEELIKDLMGRFRDVNEQNKFAVAETLRRFAYTESGAHEFEMIYLLCLLHPEASRVSGDLLVERFNSVSEVVEKRHVFIGHGFLSLFGKDERGIPLLSGKAFQQWIVNAKRHVGTSTKAGLGVAMDGLGRERRNWKLTNAVFSQLVFHGNIKEHVWNISGSIRTAVREKGGNYEAFFNLNDSRVVRAALPAILELSDPKDQSKIKGGIFEKTGYPVSQFQARPVLFDIYADEIAEVLGLYPYDFSSSAREKIEVHLSHLTFVHGEGLEFKLLSRKSDDVKLGHRCGDCTRIGGENFWSVASYLIHPSINILQVFYDRKLIDKIDLVLILQENTDELILGIEGHEPIPEMDERALFEFPLRDRKEEIFGLEIAKVREIARKIGAVGLKAVGISNRQYVEKRYADSFGDRSPRTMIQLIGNAEPFENFLKKYSLFPSEGSVIYFQMTKTGEWRGEIGSWISGLEYVILKYRRGHDTNEFDSAIGKSEFNDAARLILEHPDYRELKEEVKEHLQLLEQHGISLEEVLKILYSFSETRGYASLYSIPLESSREVEGNSEIAEPLVMAL